MILINFVSGLFFVSFFFFFFFFSIWKWEDCGGGAYSAYIFRFSMKFSVNVCAGGVGSEDCSIPMLIPC